MIRRNLAPVMANEIEITGIYTSINIKVESGEGVFFFAFDEDDKGRLIRILSWGGKAGSAQSAWLDCLTRIISSQLEKGVITIEELKIHLSLTRSDRTRINKDGVVCSSGPEALFIALLKYTNIKHREFTKNLPILRKGVAE